MKIITNILITVFAVCSVSGCDGNSTSLKGISSNTADPTQLLEDTQSDSVSPLSGESEVKPEVDDNLGQQTDSTTDLPRDLESSNKVVSGKRCDQIEAIDVSMVSARSRRVFEREGVSGESTCLRFDVSADKKIHVLYEETRGHGSPEVDLFLSESGPDKTPPRARTEEEEAVEFYGDVEYRCSTKKHRAECIINATQDRSFFLRLANTSSAYQLNIRELKALGSDEKKPPAIAPTPSLGIFNLVAATTRSRYHIDVSAGQRYRVTLNPSSLAAKAGDSKTHAIVTVPPGYNPLPIPKDEQVSCELEPVEGQGNTPNSCIVFTQSHALEISPYWVESGPHDARVTGGLAQVKVERIVPGEGIADFAHYLGKAPLSHLAPSDSYYEIDAVPGRSYVMALGRGAQAEILAGASKCEPLPNMGKSNIHEHNNDFSCLFTVNESDDIIHLKTSGDVGKRALVIAEADETFSSQSNADQPTPVFANGEVTIGSVGVTGASFYSFAAKPGASALIRMPLSVGTVDMKVFDSEKNEKTASETLLCDSYEVFEHERANAVPTCRVTLPASGQITIRVSGSRAEIGAIYTLTAELR